MNILFLCVGNSARSQIAEGLAKNMFGQHNNIFSAGSKPTSKVHEGAIDTMKKIGINISNQLPKSIDDLDYKFLENLDYVITLCSEEICPTLPSGAKSLHWATEDPANPKLSKIESEVIFRKTRETIFNLLKKFMLDNL
jgi:arsenate reductase